MKLLDIKIIKPLKMTPLDSKYWQLTDDLYAKFITNEGTYHLKLKKGWITDLRSGCDVINMLVPKWGNDIYTITILFHDCAWSGWVSRELSNEILRQGMILSGEIGSFRAGLVFKAVQTFGTYYNLDDALPEPYTINRVFESLKLLDK